MTRRRKGGATLNLTPDADKTGERLEEGRGRDRARGEVMAISRRARG